LDLWRWRDFLLKWFFFSFKAERMIRYVKDQLSQACRANENKRWLHLLPAVCENYNNQNVTGTNVKRKTVSQYNYVSLLEQLRQSTAPTMLFNIATTTVYPPPLERLLFRFKVGDPVLFARRSDYTVKDFNHFEKPSQIGAFGPRVYTVVGRAGKNNGALFICPVYKLTSPDTGLLSSWAYEDEMKPALYAAATLTRRKKRVITEERRRSRRLQHSEEKKKKLRKKRKKILGES